MVRILQNVRGLEDDKFFQCSSNKDNSSSTYKLQPQHVTVLEALQEVVQSQMTAEFKFQERGNLTPC